MHRESSSPVAENVPHVAEVPEPRHIPILNDRGRGQQQQGKVRKQNSFKRIRCISILFGFCYPLDSNLIVTKRASFNQVVYIQGDHSRRLNLPLTSKEKFCFSMRPMC